jgi:peptide/nickel transport system substrate-binding protein
VTTRRDLLKYATVAGAGAGLAVITGPSGTAVLAQATPKAGGTLNVGIQADIKVLDPNITTLAAYHSMLRFTLFETLVEVDDNANYVPNLAESWKFADDGLSLTVNLVKGAKFHNGKDFTSQDVVFTVKRLQDPVLKSQWQPQVASVTSVDTPDDATAIFRFNAPTPAFLENLLNVQILTEQGIDQINTHPVGTGPFEFVEWVPNDHITVKKFAGYRQEGLPYLDEVIFHPILDPDVRLTNIQAGSVGVVEQPSPKDAERIKADANLDLLVTPPTSKYDNIQINCTNPVTANPKVRQALSFAFDRDTYVKDILYGFGKPAVGPFSETSWAYDAAIVEPYLKFDLDKAKQLLDEAGQADGSRLSKLEIMSPKGFDELKSAAVLLQASLSSIGVNASITELELAGWIDRLVTKPDYEITTDTYGYGDTDPATVLSRDNFAPDTNVHLFRNDDYKALVQKGATTPKQDDRKKIYSQIQQLLMDQMPGFLLAHRSDLFVTRKTVHGFNPGPLIRHHYTKVWME